MLNNYYVCREWADRAGHRDRTIILYCNWPDIPIYLWYGNGERPTALMCMDAGSTQATPSQYWYMYAFTQTLGLGIGRTLIRATLILRVPQSL